MKTEWDYTELAESYLKRPDYAREAINKMFKITGVKKGDRACDVGAGVAHLTLLLLEYGLNVNAVEPNKQMRILGENRTEQNRTEQNRTEQNRTCVWSVGVGEDTGMPSDYFDIVTFGSSFNVCDRTAALAETKRILKPNGWFACMWNHRDLNDKLQSEIENIFKRNIPDYSYGTRREDQMQFLKDSGIFTRLEFTEAKVVHTISADDFIEAWKSHGTVHRQAKDRFDAIISEITELVQKEGNEIQVPYQTKIWMGQVNK